MELKNFEKKNREGNKYYFFSKFSDLIKLVEDNRTSGNWFDASETGNYEFTKTNNMDEAIELAKFGWKEGIKKLNSNITINNMKMEYKNEFNVVGSHVSVPRYLNGHPENMIRKVQIPKRDNVINLVRFASVTADTTANKLIAEGVKFIQLVQNLESQGYRCNIDIIFASEHYVDNTHQLVRLRIKNSNERLNIAKMSFPMCHPSTFRRFIFKVRYLETGSADGYRSWNAKGNSYMKMKVKPYLENNDYLIPLEIEDPENYKLEKVA